MELQQFDGDWEAAVWDEWARSLPWSATYLDLRERARHARALVERHHWYSWDFVDKALLHAREKRTRRAARLPLADRCTRQHQRRAGTLLIAGVLDKSYPF